MLHTVVRNTTKKKHLLPRRRHMPAFLRADQVIMIVRPLVELDLVVVLMFLPIAFSILAGFHGMA